MNIVVFIVDQLSARWLEESSALACPTPNLDRLRRAGVTFTNAYTSNPVCCAARATLATGLTSRGHGVLQNGYRLNPGASYSDGDNAGGRLADGSIWQAAL